MPHKPFFMLIFVPLFLLNLMLQEILQNFRERWLMLECKHCIIKNFVELILMEGKLFFKVEFEENKSKCLPCESSCYKFQMGYGKLCYDFSENINLFDQFA